MWIAPVSYSLLCILCLSYSRTARSTRYAFIVTLHVHSVVLRCCATGTGIFSGPGEELTCLMNHCALSLQISGCPLFPFADLQFFQVQLCRLQLAALTTEIGYFPCQGVEGYTGWHAENGKDLPWQKRPRQRLCCRSR